MADAYDVVIVGSGPAGMFAARELDDKGIGSILLIDEGKTARKRHCPMEVDGVCHKCKTCNVMHGVGGAGTFSDGTLNLRPDIGGDLRDLTKDDRAAWDLVKYVDNIWVEYGAPPPTKKPDPEKECLHCGTILKRKRFGGRLEDRGVFLRRVYCNRTCMASAYVSDTSQPNSKRRRTSRYRGSNCENCGTSTPLHGHHIDGNLDNDSPQNIQTLCASCHATHHHRARRAGLTVPGRMG